MTCFLYAIEYGVVYTIFYFGWLVKMEQELTATELMAEAPASATTESASMALETQQPQQQTKKQRKSQDRASNRAQHPKKRKKHANTRFAEPAPKYSFANGTTLTMRFLFPLQCVSLIRAVCSDQVIAWWSRTCMSFARFPRSAGSIRSCWRSSRPSSAPIRLSTTCVHHVWLAAWLPSLIGSVSNGRSSPSRLVESQSTMSSCHQRPSSRTAI